MQRSIMKRWGLVCGALIALGSAAATPAAHADSARACAGYAEAWDRAVRSGSARTIAKARADAQPMRPLCPELLGRIDRYRPQVASRSNRPQAIVKAEAVDTVASLEHAFDGQPMTVNNLGDNLSAPLKDKAALIAKSLNGMKFRRNPLLASDDTGIMLMGLDVVSALDEKKEIGGDLSWPVFWRGAIWLFTSKDNLAKFGANPEKYMPAYGGMCAYCAAIGDVRTPDWKQFEVYNGRLYFFQSVSVHDDWSKNKDGFISQADNRWPSFRVSDFSSMDSYDDSKAIAQALKDLNSGQSPSQ